MLYTLFRWFFAFCVKIFYNTIALHGLKNIPKTDPVIFIGNHPNGLVDPSLVFTGVTFRKISFVAAGYLFKMPIIGFILRSLRAIPVVRKQDNNGSRANNSSAIDNMADRLREGNCIAIFPEGLSHDSSEILDFKTGFAQAAFAALKSNPSLKIHIVAVGMNYDAKNRFRSDVFLAFGEPLTLDSKWLAKFEQDSGAALKEVAALGKTNLDKVLINSKNPEHIKLGHLARKIYREHDSDVTPEEYVTMTKKFVEMFETESAADEKSRDAEVHQLKTDLHVFQTQMDLLGVNYAELINHKILYSKALYTLLMLPVALPGSLIHAPLGVLAGIIGRKLGGSDLDQQANFKMMPVIVLLPVVYAIIWIVASFVYGMSVACLLIAAIVASGYIAVVVRPLHFTFHFATSILKLMLFDQAKMQEEQKRIYAELKNVIEKKAPEMKGLLRPKSFISRRTE